PTRPRRPSPSALHSGSDQARPPPARRPQRAKYQRRWAPKDDSQTTTRLLAFAFCLLPSAYCSSESLPEANLKTEIVVLRSDGIDRALLILRDEREPIRDAIFERDDLVLLGRHVGRIGQRQIAIDLPADREPRRRACAAAPGDERIDLEAVQAEQLV